MKVLDHGYVNLIESWGSDERIVRFRQPSGAERRSSNPKSSR